jgi:lipid-binding SYLF domain-containing protein
MKHHTINSIVSSLAIAMVALLSQPSQASAASAAKIDADSRAALRNLYHTNPRAQELGNRAEYVLVFPSIIKGGFLIGGMHGEGALLGQHGTYGYYKTVAASYGLQAGIQKFGYALFFMNGHSLSHLHGQGGWEVGTSPSVVVVNKGMAGSLNTTQLKSGIYALFFNQKGLMGGLGLQGSKITEIHPR